MASPKRSLKDLMAAASPKAVALARRKRLAAMRRGSTDAAPLAGCDSGVPDPEETGPVSSLGIASLRPDENLASRSLSPKTVPTAAAAEGKEPPADVVESADVQSAAAAAAAESDGTSIILAKTVNNPREQAPLSPDAALQQRRQERLQALIKQQDDAAAVLQGNNHTPFVPQRV